jgi:hypothetical protein
MDINRGPITPRIPGGILVETDPVFAASPAFGITALLIAAWNTAVSLEHAAVTLGAGSDPALALSGQQLTLTLPSKTSLIPAFQRSWMGI